MAAISCRVPLPVFGWLKLLGCNVLQKAEVNQVGKSPAGPTVPEFDAGAKRRGFHAAQQLQWRFQLQTAGKSPWTW
jgi:hypothetical protein